MGICDIRIRDPFVVPENGCYYLFGSTDKDIWKSRATGFDVYVSRQNGSPSSLLHLWIFASLMTQKSRFSELLWEVAE
jgi:hypothetical protein